jgi:hypothetical protein
VKITSGNEVVINNACSFVDLFMATESIFVENQLVQNLAKYKKNNLVNGKTLASIIKQYMGNKIGYFFQKKQKSVTF